MTESQSTRMERSKLPAGKSASSSGAFFTAERKRPTGMLFDSASGPSDPSAPRPFTTIASMRVRRA